jgi:hypothetical protein
MLHNLYRELKRCATNFDSFTESSNSPEIQKDYYELTATVVKNRTYMFAKALFDFRVQKQCREFDDKNRLWSGMPDSIYSLMEGLTGTLAFESDLLRDEDDVRFPGFEI